MSHAHVLEKKAPVALKANRVRRWADYTHAHISFNFKHEVKLDDDLLWFLQVQTWFTFDKFAF